MAVLTITDLPANRDLDRSAMAAIRGGGRGDWVFGTARPFVKAPAAPAHFGGPESGGPESINFYQVINNNYFVENKTISLVNSGSNATVNAVMISSC
jgi:hypothetical protein